MKNKVRLGSISSGTMRGKDFIPALISECKYYGIKTPKGIGKRIKKADYFDSEDADFDTEELFDSLNNIAPSYCYFGAHPGNGSDYGFWPCEDWQEMMEDDSVMFVSDTSDVTRQYYGLICHINDHGNVTLYHKSRNNKWREIWSIV